MLYFSYFNKISQIHYKILLVGYKLLVHKSLKFILENCLRLYFWNKQNLKHVFSFYIQTLPMHFPSICRNVRIIKTLFSNSSIDRLKILLITLTYELYLITGSILHCLILGFYLRLKTAYLRNSIIYIWLSEITLKYLSFVEVNTLGMWKQN